jgi:hypothetical protein
MRNINHLLLVIGGAHAAPFVSFKVGLQFVAKLGVCCDSDCLSLFVFPSPSLRWKERVLLMLEVGLIATSVKPTASLLVAVGKSTPMTTRASCRGASKRLVLLVVMSSLITRCWTRESPAC